jgi:SAM-dependent methyltransferase
VLATGAAAPAEAVVLDIASGPGQYLLDTLARFSGRPVRAICWDLDDRWLAEGRRSAQRMGFGPLNTVTFARADALAADSFVSLVCRPNIVVASGFYDWMDDPTIRRSMGLVFDALPADGRFVFTHQTGHACIEMVNQVFTHFDGQPLRMATRPAAMVHDWARQAGFRIERSAADSQSYYTATLARKV